PSGAPRLGLVGEQLEGVAPVRAGETLGRVAVRIIEYVGEELRLLRPHDVPVVIIQDDRVGAYRAEVAFDVLDRGKPGRRGMKRHPDLAGRAGVHHGAECESLRAPFAPAELAGRRELDGSRDGKSVTPGLNVMTPVGASGVPPQVHTRLPRSGAARPAVTWAIASPRAVIAMAKSRARPCLIRVPSLSRTSPDGGRPTPPRR